MHDFGYTPRMLDFGYIALEGPIAVGKCALTQRLVARLDASVILDETDNPFLPDFYAGRAGAAFQAQLFSLLASITLLAAIATSGYAEKITHSFIGVGKANKTVIVGEDGKVKWRVDLPASDGWVLPSGNVLLALYGTKDFPNGGVAEIDRKTKKIVWSYMDDPPFTLYTLMGGSVERPVSYTHLTLPTKA